MLCCEETSTIDHAFFAWGALGRGVPEPLLERILRAMCLALGKTVLDP